MLDTIDGRSQLTPVHIPRPQPAASRPGPREAVQEIVGDVRLRGDAAVLEYTERFDNATLARAGSRVEGAAIAKARSLVRPALIDALEIMAERLRRISNRQLPKTWLERSGDELTGELIVPIGRSGIYVPGGRAPHPSAVIAAAVPARVAGVEGIAVCSPPGGGGEVAESVLAACSVAGITEVYRIGGAQAVAALAYGTESVRPVDKVVGSGGVHVSLAKRIVTGWVGTDAGAGPAEIAIIADESAGSDGPADDLIASAERGPLGTHALITWVPELAEEVMAALERRVIGHEWHEDVENALIEGGRAVLVRDRQHAIATANALAPEHLVLVFAGALDSLGEIRNAGAVYVGASTPAPAGDYVAGTNHVLPGGGRARFSSGLGAGDFVKRISVAGLEPSSLARLGPHAAALAAAEGMHAQARALQERLQGPPR